MKKNNQSQSENFDFSQIRTKLVKKNCNLYDFKSKNEIFSIFNKTLFNNLTVKNCMCFSNYSDNFLCDNFGNPTEEYRKFYTNIAKSDVGLIFTGGTYVGTGKFNKVSKLPKKFSTISSSRKNVGIYQSIVKDVHIHGAKIFMTLKPIYGRGDSDNRFLHIFNYSASFGRNFYDAPMPCARMSDGKCNELATSFGEAASLAKNAGFDGVVVDGTLFNILGEFSSKEFNRRKLGYYSEPVDLAARILHEINSKCGEVNILYKFTLASFLKDVYGSDLKKLHTLKGVSKTQTINETYELLVSLVKFGVDGFVLEFGTYETAFLNDFPEFAAGNLFEEIYSGIKEYFKKIELKNKFGNDVIIISNDNINDISQAAKYISNQVSDFVIVTKQIYSDNNFIRKIKAKKPFVPCIKCSKCNYSFEKFDTLACTVNPNIFGEKLIPTTRENKRVAVVGAGISGLTCAVWLAKRGYNVELYEKSSKLNKTGKLCEIFGYDELLSEYNKNLESEAKKLANEGKIKLMLSSEFLASNPNLKAYFSVIVATGFHEKYLSISGAVLGNVKSIYEVLSDKRYFSDKKNIVIYAKSELSIKLAIYLLINNKKVNVIFQNTDLLNKLSNGKLTYYIKALKDLKASVYLQTRVKRIEDDFVELIINDKIKKESFDTVLLNLRANINYSYEARAKNIDCDLFVYEPDIYPNNRLYYELVKSGYAGELYMIGSALLISDMENDIKTAFYVAKNL